MNLQIFGRSKCFDTKKAERYFKERNIPYQRVDVDRFGLSQGELRSVIQAVGGVDHLVRTGKDPEIVLMSYLASEEAKVEKLLEQPKLLRTPIVRNGRQATVGYAPDIWASWQC